MKIIIPGGTGLIGSYLSKYFSERGHEVVIFSRSKNVSTNKSIRFVEWDGKTMQAWKSEIDGADVVINLTGRNINCRHTEKNKNQIVDSRVQSTAVIGEAIQLSKQPPKVWINMSGVGIYDEAYLPQDEFSGKIGNDFMAMVCRQWEKTFYNATVPHTRKIVTRLAVVFAEKGGAITPFKRLARFGAGGKMGTGKQMVSWIFIEDVARAIEFLISDDSLSGIFNITSPEGITNKELMKSIRRSVGIPIGIPSTTGMIKLGAFVIGTDPGFVLRSSWAIPKKLIAAGFKFRYPTIASALNIN